MIQMNKHDEDKRKQTRTKQKRFQLIESKRTKKKYKSQIEKDSFGGIFSTAHF